jgi:hypothetical protein
MKKIFKSQWGKIFFSLILVYILLVISSFLWKNGPVYALLWCFLWAAYFPIGILSFGYLRPLLLEKLKLEPDEKIIFEGVWSYMVELLPILIIVFAPGLFGLFSPKKMFLQICIFIVFSLGFFCFNIIPPILKVKKMKKE